MAKHQLDVSEPRPGDLESGTRIGRYRIEKVVGRGGMGTVYRAFDEDTKREVAIKVLLPGLPDLLKERFLAECEAEAKIRHPHVMPVYDRGTFEGGRLYFVMELVYEPITLTDVVEANLTGLTSQRWPRLRHWAQPTRLVHDVIIPICDGVQAANHDFGIFHRDIKPDNVLIDVRTRRASLIDFGICYRRGQALEARKIIGTPRFLSPEQAQGKIHERTDVFGCGALLYYVFTGRPPIEASSPLRQEERANRVKELAAEEERARKAGDDDRVAELAARRAALEDPDLRTVDDMVRDARAGRYGPLPDSVPTAARAIIAKAMALEPDRRYANAGELAADLRRWVEGGAVRALAERTTTGAAVAAARRTMRRHVKTALWVVLGLVMGLPLGARLLSGEGEAAAVLAANVEAELYGLQQELDDLASFAPYSIDGARRWRDLREALAVMADRVASMSEGEARDAATGLLAELRGRLPRPPLSLETPNPGPWKAGSVVDHKTVEVEPGETGLAPGPWWLQDATGRVRIPFLLPVAVGTDAAEPTVVAVELPQGGVPVDMVYVPAGPPAAGEEALRPFFLGVAEVTCVEYAEWLDELSAEERADRLPPKGFLPDENMPGRYIVDPDYADRPVTRVRPRDAAEYAAWRSEIYGADMQIPSEAQWRRAAGAALLRPEYAAFFVPLQEVDGRLRPDRTPFGAEGLLTDPAELVTKGGGFALKAAGAGPGIPPSEADLARSVDVDPDARPDAGFRLVQMLRQN